jgi:GntR family transcriptional regulator / MocR family aminotransferase
MEMARTRKHHKASSSVRGREDGRRRGALAASDAVLSIGLEGDSRAPLQRRIYHALRSAILARRLRPGDRLPSSRQYAESLEVSRTTIALVYEQLRAEGYIEGRERSGTFVATALPDDSLVALPASQRAVATVKSRPAITRAAPGPKSPVVSGAASLSARGALLASLDVSSSISSTVVGPRAFRLGTPALDAFPYTLWGRLLARRWRQFSASQLAYGSANGFAPLRSAIAEHVRTARAVTCHDDQVLIVSGAQQAFDLVARVLLDPGDTVCVEDPGYRGLRSAFEGAGARLVPVTVDAEGIDVATGVAFVPGARLTCVTPSHQFPLGITMSAARRLALLQWADNANAWILEDDFDSEYRFRGRPLPSLQGMDPHGRVVYVGTFSKTLFPSLRLGFLIVPTVLVDAFARARAVLDRHSPQLEQAVLADFIAEGHLVRHIRRMRAIYTEREARLRALLHEGVGEFVEPSQADAGMHLVAWVTGGGSDRRLADLADAAGIAVAPLSGLASHRLARGALLMGFAAFDEQAMRRGVESLRTAWLGGRGDAFASHERHR